MEIIILISLLLPFIVLAVVYGACRLLRRQWKSRRQLWGVAALGSGSLVVSGGLLVAMGIAENWFVTPGADEWANFLPMLVLMGAAIFTFIGAFQLVAGVLMLIVGKANPPIIVFFAAASLVVVGVLLAIGTFIGATIGHLSQAWRHLLVLVSFGGLVVLLLINWRGSLASRVYMTSGLVALISVNSFLPFILPSIWMPSAVALPLSLLVTAALFVKAHWSRSVRSSDGSSD